MKHLPYIIGCAAPCPLAGCNRDGERSGGDQGGRGKELSFYAVVNDARPASRANGNSFFETDHAIDVMIVSDDAPEKSGSYTYITGTTVYSVAIRRSISPSMTATVTTLTAVWPSQSVRDEGFKTDQREIDDYRHADWLQATARAWEGICLRTLQCRSTSTVRIP